jgi:hypothetical protein
MLNNSYRVAGVLLLFALLGGCATKPTTLYQWQGYQSHVDAHFRGDTISPDAQAQLMEADLEKIKVAGGQVPPGFLAHLGLLYGQQGRLDQFAQQVQAEKQLFPESATFMDFLLRKFKK